MTSTKRDLSKKRQKRQRFDGPRDILSFDGKDPNYHYHVFNDKEDRLARAEKAGYEYVTSEENLGDGGAGTATPTGTTVTRPVGGGMTGVLMRIKKEWYDEDQAEKQRELDEREEELRRLVKDDRYYGDIKIK